MKIGIDARLIEETGVGRYIRNLIRELSVLDTTNEYVVFLMKKSYEGFTVPNARWHKRLTDVPWHSLAEQLIMPWMFLWERLNLVHIPYFNAPMLYPGKMVVTIHDLTILHTDTGKATTLSPLAYRLRRSGYKIILTSAIRRAVSILTVSEATKKDIMREFNIPGARIVVAKEGVDGNIQSTESGQTKPLVPTPYLLYVGNAYPHKNIETLIEAFRLMSTGGVWKLALVGNDDFFYGRIKALVKQLGLQDKVVFLHGVDDGQLNSLYKNATLLVFPSLMEGFGLPGLEAMAAGTPVVCSDIAAFREIYGDAALYFDPKDASAMYTTLINVLGDQSLRQKLIENGKAQLKLYSWSQMAQKTLETYEGCARI